MSTDPKGHNPTALDRWLLVRYKKYPNAQQIPNNVRFVFLDFRESIFF